MFNIASFLEKFSKNISNTEIHTQSVLEIIKKNTQIELSKDQVEIKDGGIRVTASPGVKNKIFMYKEKILEEVNSSLSVKVQDIR